MTKYNKEEIERLVEFLDIMIVTNDWNDPFLFGGKGIDNLKAIRQILEGLEMPDEGVVQKLLDIGIDCQLAIQSGKSNSLEYYKQKTRQLLSTQKKPEISRGEIEKWLEEEWNEDWCDLSYYNELIDWLMDLLRSKGFTVREK